MISDNLPVAIIGAGPVGLAAAAKLLARGLQPVILEAGPGVGSGPLSWGHVRMFSPWRYNLDRDAVALLEQTDWQAPDPEAFPNGGDLVSAYLQPLAAHPAIASALHLGARVSAVTRLRRDRMKNADRDARPFLIHYRDADGEQALLARAVIDASGTLGNPSPLGASGIAALGEEALRAHIVYGLPDVLGRERGRYLGRRVLLVGSGHSAFNVLLDLAALARQAPETRILWAVRRPLLAPVLGGGANDGLPERGRLGLAVKRLVDSGRIELVTAFELERLRATPAGIVAEGNGTALPAVDEIVACTGFRPDLSLLSELRLDLDEGTQSPRRLAPLIDPNVHSCGSVRPHGAEALAHPDRGLYVVGMKSYGRAPTFLLLTGYEQVRSVVAAIAGDHEAARRVELVLPETGVCSSDFAAPDEAVVGCCGGPARGRGDACCVADEYERDAGRDGCGCSAPPLDGSAQRLERR